MSCPSGHIMFIQRRISVDGTSCARWGMSTGATLYSLYTYLADDIIILLHVFIFFHKNKTLHVNRLRFI